MANSREYRNHLTATKLTDADPSVGSINLRKGKWTVEEETYANKIIDLFNQGLLPIAAGTTLRTYLSEKLACDPMRITKKFAGASCIGKQVFQPYDRAGAEDLMNLFKQSEKELALLEERFLSKIRSKRGSANYLSPQLTDKSYGTRNISGNKDIISENISQTSPIAESSSFELNSHRNKESRYRKRVDTAYKAGILQQVEENDEEDGHQESDESASEPEDSFNGYHYAFGGSGMPSYLASKEEDITRTNHILGEEYLRQFHLHMQKLNEDSNEQLSKGRRGTVSHGTGYNEILLGSDSEDVLKSSFRFGKRVKSAPNLSRHERNVDFLNNSNLYRIKKGNNTQSRIEREGNSEIHASGSSYHYATMSSQLVCSTSSISGIRAPKRSHSVMALMEFEKFVNDDHAADDLFLEFVQSVNNAREQSGENSISLPKSLATQKLGTNSALLTGETAVNKISINSNCRVSGNAISSTDGKNINQLTKPPSTHSLSSGVTTSSTTGSHRIGTTSSTINDTSNMDVSNIQFSDQLIGTVVSSSSEHQKRIIDSANTTSELESRKKANVSIGNVTVALEASSIAHMSSSNEVNVLKCDITDSNIVQVTRDSAVGALYVDQSRSSLVQDNRSNLEEHPMYEEENFF